MGCSKSGSKSNIGLPPELIKISKSLTLHLKELKKEEKK